MTIEGFYWATISAILFSMLFARREGVATIITIAGVGMLYASDSIGSIYTIIYNSFENELTIDFIFLSALLGLIYLIWAVFFSLSELLALDRNIKRYFSDLGTTFIAFLGILIMAILYIVLCYNASSIICSLSIPVIIFAFAFGSSSSKEENGDDFLTFALIGSIVIFGVMCWFNNLLENYNIVMASGCYIYEYTYGASFVPASLITIPIFLAIRFIGYHLIELEEMGEQGNIDTIETNKKEMVNETE